MTAEWLHNLIAWSAQVCVLVAAAALAAMALKQPRVRLWFWQATLALALLLPIMQPRLSAPARQARSRSPLVLCRSQLREAPHSPSGASTSCT